MMIPLRALVRRDLRLFFVDRRAVLMSFLAPIVIASFFGYIFGGQGANHQGTITRQMLAFATFTEHDVSEQTLVDAVANVSGNIVKLPAGWQHGTALETAATDGATVKFKRVSYEALVDSPLIAGKYFRKFDLDPGGRSRVTLDVAADEPQYLEARPPAVTVAPPPPPMRYGVLCCQAILFVLPSIAVKVPLIWVPIGAACVPPT